MKLQEEVATYENLTKAQKEETKAARAAINEVDFVLCVKARALVNVCVYVTDRRTDIQKLINRSTDRR